MENYCECTQYTLCIFCRARQEKQDKEALLAVRKSISGAVLWLFRGPEPKYIPGKTRPIDEVGKVLDKIFF